jgi:hypothetical protein
MELHKVYDGAELVKVLYIDGDIVKTGDDRKFCTVKQWLKLGSDMMDAGFDIVIDDNVDAEINLLLNLKDAAADRYMLEESRGNGAVAWGGYKRTTDRIKAHPAWRALYCTDWGRELRIQRIEQLLGQLI